MELSLRIWHPTESPEAISLGMGLTPTLSYRAGEPRVTPSGRVLDWVHSETLWSYSIALPEPISLAQAIEFAGSVVAERRTYLQELRSRGAQFEYFVGIFPDSTMTEVLPPAALRLCVDEGISLVLNVYPNPES